ncbi:hypothetical protein BU23DRAFT_555457 [Bimuria novae-zelandiae CBS 107.79]|uniref:Uncharacterized protein n=1 Tax=Bimuria novae-zelandiae CBS 107.79 TaxID=1447943 RepID=A0A6A5V4G9_9PLEO|nr:hypothetical protein BU23DRAFT_555457 [Bimuria novae-zelandiae CBS 107.79]
MSASTEPDASDPAVQALYPLPAYFQNLRPAQAERDFLQHSWTCMQISPYPAYVYEVRNDLEIAWKKKSAGASVAWRVGPPYVNDIAVIGGVRGVDEAGTDGDKASSLLNFARASLLNRVLTQFPQLADAAGIVVEEKLRLAGYTPENYSEKRRQERTNGSWDEAQCCNEIAKKVWDRVRKHVQCVIEDGECPHALHMEPLEPSQIQAINAGLAGWGFMFEEAWSTEE